MKAEVIVVGRDVMDLADELEGMEHGAIIACDLPGARVLAQVILQNLLDPKTLELLTKAQREEEASLVDSDERKGAR